MSGHVTGIASWDGEKLRLCDPVVFNAGMRRLKPGNGEEFQVRVERREEAWRYSDVKHLYGHLYTPVSKRTGETVSDVHLRMKADHFPDDGRDSLTDLNRVEMKQYIEAVEQDIRENDPDSWEDCVAAMSLYERSHRRSA